MSRHPKASTIAALKDKGSSVQWPAVRVDLRERVVTAVKNGRDVPPWSGRNAICLLGWRFRLPRPRYQLFRSRGALI